MKEEIKKQIEEARSKFELQRASVGSSISLTKWLENSYKTIAIAAMEGCRLEEDRYIQVEPWMSKEEKRFAIGTNGAVSGYNSAAKDLDNNIQKQKELIKGE